MPPVVHAILDRFVAWVAETGLSLYPHQEEGILALLRRVLRLGAVAGEREAKRQDFRLVRPHQLRECLAFAGQHRGGGVGQRLGVDILDLDPGMVLDPGVPQRLVQRLVGILQVNVLADERNVGLVLERLKAADCAGL